MKKAIKYILILLGLGVLLFALYVGYQLHIGIFWFGLEDRVVHSYLPVRDGIAAYQEKNGSLPAGLGDLIPEYVEGLPELEEVKSFAYNIVGHEDWELIAIVEAKGKKREFVYRSTHELTVEEKARLWTGCHEWFVLRIEE